MKNLIPLFAAIIVVSLSIAGCSKGDRGPAGPAGPAGPDSIFYSAWASLQMPLNTNDSLYEETITASALTSTFLDNGALLSYVAIPPATSGLADTLVINSSDLFTYTGGAYLTQDLLPGQIELYSNLNLTGLGAAYRYVLVPGTILSTSVFKQYTKEQIKKMDYSTLTKLANTAKTQSSTN